MGIVGRRESAGRWLRKNIPLAVRIGVVGSGAVSEQGTGMMVGLCNRQVPQGVKALALRRYLWKEVLIIGKAL